MDTTTETAVPKTESSGWFTKKFTIYASISILVLIALLGAGYFVFGKIYRNIPTFGPVTIQNKTFKLDSHNSNRSDITLKKVSVELFHGIDRLASLSKRDVILGSRGSTTIEIPITKVTYGQSIVDICKIGGHIYVTTEVAVIGSGSSRALNLSHSFSNSVSCADLGIVDQPKIGF